MKNVRKTILAIGAAALLAIASVGSVAAAGRGVGDLVPPEQLFVPPGPVCGEQISGYTSTTGGLGRGGVGPFCAYGVLGLN